MSVWDRDDFDFVSEDLDDDYYFPYMSDLIARAREILSNKSSADLVAMSKLQTILIEFSKRDIDHEVALQCTQGNDAENFATSAFYSHMRLLKIYIDERWKVSSPLTVFDFSSLLETDVETLWHPSEVFAVLTIALISIVINIWDASAEDWGELGKENLPFNVQAPVSDEDKLERNDFIWRWTCEFAIGASSALHHAESLKAEFVKEELARKIRQQKAISLNQEKYEETYETKRRVVEEWERRVNEFPSATKAGYYFYSWIEEQKLKIHEPSTLTKWIRDAAKEKGIRWR